MISGAQTLYRVVEASPELVRTLEAGDSLSGINGVYPQEGDLPASSLAPKTGIDKSEVEKTRYYQDLLNSNYIQIK